MLALKKIVETFPTARLQSRSGGLPVEVSLIAQLGHGSGDHLFANISERQRAHQEFVDELDEPSAKLAGADFSKGDPTSLYSFVVGPKGHPFHRHAGHRVFTAISGSGGAQLRFSTATPEQIASDPQQFIKQLRYVTIPPDCMFTVRFGGETWHQFAPLTGNHLHPAFFALSCHTNELGGALSEALREQVLANQATIPALTELLPPAVEALLQAPSFLSVHVPTIALSLEAPAGSLQRAMCDLARSGAGILRGAWAGWYGARGFFSDNGSGHKVVAQKDAPAGSLLAIQLPGEKIHHEDSFCLTLDAGQLHGYQKRLRASELLEAVLEGFLENPPPNVGRLMNLRNFLVRPLGLRTSPLGCPVSSLLSPVKSNLFANRYPVLDQRIDDADTRAQVILGADDKHLTFRSCVGVEIVDGRRILITLGTRVHCKNLFGRLYMGVIDHAHRAYISPTMLRMAVEHAFAESGEGVLAVPV
jgi:hypothetical protein